MSKFLNDEVVMSLKIVFILANGANPDKMPSYIWVYTVCQSTCLSVSGMKRAKHAFAAS